jgi:hypothetical protein
VLYQWEESIFNLIVSSGTRNYWSEPHYSNYCVNISGQSRFFGEIDAVGKHGGTVPKKCIKSAENINITGIWKIQGDHPIRV